MTVTWKKQRYVFFFSAILLFQTISWVPQAEANAIDMTYASTNRKQKKHTTNKPSEGGHPTPLVHSGSITDGVKDLETKYETEKKDRRVRTAAPYNVEQEVKEIISKQLDVPIDNIRPRSSMEDLGADSLDTEEIVMALEEEFDNVVSDVGDTAIKTVQDLIDMVQSKQ